MEKVNVKKIILMLLVFSIFAILITILMIFLKINSLPINTDFEENFSGDDEVIQLIGTKKNQKYDQNDLNIINENVNYKELEYQSIRISGLKDKTIESRINEELENVENDFRERVLEASGENTSMYLASFVNANYSNILSVSFYGSKQNSNYRNEINIYKFLNFDLTTGNQIELEDLFLPNTDIDLLAQNYIYREKLHEKFSEKDIFFSSEYWENGKLNYLVNDLDELDFMNEFLKYKNSKKDFYVTPTGVSIRYNEDPNDGIVFITFKDNLDKVVAYDKFLSNETIYESSNIGLKDLYVCSDVTLNSDDTYNVIEDVAPNFKIDARVYIFSNQAYDKYELYKNAIENVKKEIDEIKYEYLKKAEENKNMYYFVEIFYDVDNFDPAYRNSHDKFIVTKQEQIYETSVEDFSNWFEDKIIAAYTSENYTIDYFMNIVLNDDEKEKCNLQKLHEAIVYDINTNEKVTDIEKLLVEGTDYVSAMADYLKKYHDLSREKVEEILKNHKYYLDRYGIVIPELDNLVGYGIFAPSDYK